MKRLTLYERLRPEVKERLLNQDEAYSIVVDRIINLLKSKHYYTDLRIRDSQTLHTFTDTVAKDVYDFKWGEHLFLDYNHED